MAFLILLVGIFIVGTCLSFFIFPGLVDDLIQWLGRQRNLYIVVSIRLVVGVLLVMGASSTRFPSAVWWLGVLFIAAAVLLAVLSPERIKRITENFLHRSVLVVRLWVLVPMGLGIFLLASVL